MEQRLQALAARFNALEAGVKDVQRALAGGAAASAHRSTAPAHTHKAPAAAASKRPIDAAALTELQPCAQDVPDVAAVRRWCLENSLHSAVFKWVPSNYYEQTLQWRRDILDAATIGHLCKTIVLENTHCTNADCAVRENSRYYMIVYRYVDKFVAEMVMRAIKDLNEGLGKKKFNFRLADPAVALELTGFSHGAVCPFATRTPIPVMLSSEVAALTPGNFWIGGGHVDCKVRVDVQNFIDVVNPFVAPITVPLTPEELAQVAD